MVANREALLLWLIMMGYGACSLYMLIMTVRLTMGWLKLHVKQMAALAIFYGFLAVLFFIRLIIASPFYRVATGQLDLEEVVAFSEASPLLYLTLFTLVGIFISGFMVDYYMRATENE